MVLLTVNAIQAHLSDSTYTGTRPLQVKVYQDPDLGFWFTPMQAAQAVERSPSSITIDPQHHTLDENRNIVILYSESEATEYWISQAKKGNPKATILLNQIGMRPNALPLPSDAKEIIIAKRNGLALSVYSLPAIESWFLSSRQICAPVSASAGSFKYWLKEELLENGSYALVCPSAVKGVKVYSANIALSYWSSILAKYSSRWESKVNASRLCEKASHAISILTDREDRIDEIVKSSLVIYPEELNPKTVIYPICATRVSSCRTNADIDFRPSQELQIANQLLQRQINCQAVEIRELNQIIKLMSANLSELKSLLEHYQPVGRD
ncbi:MAG: hypothetical protein H7126_12140 [Candidatus Parcubacteria bacterium]|nr:hypothetical protein [Leptolyngbyaceae cyanobacterium LF-bin-113]